MSSSRIHDPVGPEPAPPVHCDHLHRIQAPRPPTGLPQPPPAPCPPPGVDCPFTALQSSEKQPEGSLQSANQAPPPPPPGDSPCPLPPTGRDSPWGAPWARAGSSGVGQCPRWGQLCWEAAGPPDRDQQRTASAPDAELFHHAWWGEVVQGRAGQGPASPAGHRHSPACQGGPRSHRQARARGPLGSTAPLSWTWSHELRCPQGPPLSPLAPGVSQR